MRGGSCTVVAGHLNRVSAEKKKAVNYMNYFRFITLYLYLI